MDCFCSNCEKKYSINPSKIPVGRKYAKCKACGGKIPLQTAKKCRKCGYIRKSTDTAPDWECPGCGIIYEKIENVTQKSNKVDKKIKDTDGKDKEKKQNKIKHDAKEEDNNTPSILSKKKFDYNKYTLFYVFFSLVIGYFAGREHVKYEMRKIFKSGIESIADGINRGGDNKSSKMKAGDKNKKTKEIKMLPVKILDKRYEKKEYQDYISISLEFTNNLKKALRAYQGYTVFTDILGNKIITVTLKNQEIVEEGETFIWAGTINFNQFMQSHIELKNTSLDDLRIKFVLDKVIYADGTEEKFNQ
ncbi:MAG: hypothetical protein D3903_09430 [Candidatus Electrothrix sp. GM3_4]|nr:hypothetical protein [Candidatus Electrothrix sp. GM3_4]